jgi:hypothetical protein
MSLSVLPLRRASFTQMGGVALDLPGSPKKDTSTSGSLLNFIAIQLSCSKIALLASPDAPPSVVSRSMTTDNSKPTTVTFDNEDVQNCATQKTAVGVDMYATSLCVPILDSHGNVLAVIQCEGKTSATTGRLGTRFTLADVAIVKVVGAVLCGQGNTRKPKTGPPPELYSTSAADEEIP